MIAGGYLLLTIAAASTLVQEGYIGHGNGLSFVLTLMLTTPLSWMLMLLSNALFDLNAHAGTIRGRPVLPPFASRRDVGLLRARLQASPRDPNADLVKLAVAFRRGEREQILRVQLVGH